MKNNIIIFATALAFGGMLCSCNDYLDKEPMSAISPEQYFNDEAALKAYCDGLYTDVLPKHDNWSYGIYGNDDKTDIMSTIYPDGKYQTGDWRTDLKNDKWEWKHINSINFFFDQVLPKFEAEAISGSKPNINHYVGEMYFLRAHEYFKRLKYFGDYPIVTTCLPDELGALTEASKRSPRNEVARFILEDLDKAYELMRGNNMATTRINANTALLLKSRVALYEGTFEKNFAGTAFVPGTAEWPGKGKDYNSNFTFKSGSAENEVKYFLEEAIKAAETVAEEAKGRLTLNTGVIPEEEGGKLADYEALNPWLAMFGSLDLGGYPEVLLWRQYSDALGINHNVVVQAQKGNQGVGCTRGLVDGFTMANGLPIYAAGSGYHGDNTIHNVRLDRDPRLVVLLKEPGQKNVLIPNSDGTHANPVEGIPAFWEASAEQKYSTGYALRKGNTPDAGECGNGKASTACPVFRSVEALLNYIEAYYELNGNLGGHCAEYWTAIRARHTGLDTDFNKTINATDMSQEAKGDWGAYTAGAVIDATRYNIRRERRNELMAEGYRWDDLVRWRALDQMLTTGFHIEGIHLWNANDEMIKYLAQYGSGDNADAAKLKDRLAGIVSKASESEYVRPHRGNNSTLVVNGLTWHMAHYLEPLPIKQMMLTAPDGSTVSQSPLYQNPYWPDQPSMPATK